MNTKTAKPSIYSILSMAATCAISLMTALPSLADAPLAVGSAVPETLANVEVQNAGPLKKAGATKLSVFFVEEPDGSFSKKAFLLGTKAGKIVWKAPLPVSEEFNRAKCDVLCRNGLLYVMSQFPGCAAYISQSFRWDGVKATLVKTEKGDPSQAEVDALTALAEKGTRAQLDAWEEKEHNVMYPGNYINQQSLETLLKRGQKAALALAQSGRPAMAAARMELCFDASQDLVELADGGGEGTKTPAKWISAWKAESMDMPAEKWTPMLKDYAQYLQKCGKQKQAQTVLAAIKSENNAAKTAEQK
ncbi:MAG: hypothetical protein JSS83_19075 [Cyanobacteria bacterium SZAS LIN-3]|nr:hypothetical protein [Cyanobacteria bacterium SZAS LIN-3]